FGPEIGDEGVEVGSYEHTTVFDRQVLEPGERLHGRSVFGPAAVEHPYLAANGLLGGRAEVATEVRADQLDQRGRQSDDVFGGVPLLPHLPEEGPSEDTHGLAIGLGGVRGHGRRGDLHRETYPPERLPHGCKMRTP